MVDMSHLHVYLTNHLSDKVPTVLNRPTQPFVSWAVHRFNPDTLQRCHMVWQRGDGEVIRAKFEAFLGSHIHDLTAQELKYLWAVAENGLLQYHSAINNFYVVKPMSSLQYIEVAVMSLLENGEAVSIVCISREASGHSELVALDSFNPKGGVQWSVWDFDKETTQVCHVEFEDQKRRALVFEAFVGNWIHDLSIWDAHRGKRIYTWDAQRKNPQ